MRPLHIAIVGAGLGGLCLAQALKRSGVSCAVYEQDPAPASRTQGYRLRIDTGGQQALSRCLPDELCHAFLRSCAVATSAGQFVDVRLAPTLGRAADTWRPAATEAAPNGDRSVHRLTLREILLTGIDPQVHFGKVFCRYEFRRDGTVLGRFEDGSSVHADLLVAADGVHSAVRRQWLPDAQPEYTGAVCLYGTTRLTPAIRQAVGERLCAGGSVVFADGYAMILDPMIFRAPPAPPVIPEQAAWRNARLSHVDDYLYWAFIGPAERLGFENPQRARLTQHALKAHALGLTRDWHPRLCALLAGSDPDTLAALPVQSATPPTNWPGSRVTALGDAIHAMSPAGGLGANTALQDAAVLAALLADAEQGRLTLDTALAAYETDLRTRAAQAVSTSQQAAEKLFALTTQGHGLGRDG